MTTTIPVWVFFVGTIVIVMASIETGYWLGRVARQKSKGEKEATVSIMSQSILALGAFILAFAFGIAAGRFSVRKELVREEANAIGTAWLRSDFLSELDRAETRRLMREYVGARLAFYQSRNTESGHVERVLDQAQQLQSRMWEIAVANARKDQRSPVAALYLESLNKVFDIHALRVAQGLRDRIPTGLWAMLFGLTVLGMIGVGYHAGIDGSKRSVARPILAVSFA